MTNQVHQRKILEVSFDATMQTQLQGQQTAKQHLQQHLQQLPQWHYYLLKCDQREKLENSVHIISPDMPPGKFGTNVFFFLIHGTKVLLFKLKKKKKKGTKVMRYYKINRK